MITILLRLEGLAVLLAALIAYAAIDASWLVFIALLLVPDIVMLGYLAGPRVGAVTYNLGHAYVWPLLLLGVWALTGGTWPLIAALIWGAHIGMDRALGYGLKEPDSFQHTHLGWIGGATPGEADPARTAPGSPPER